MGANPRKKSRKPDGAFFPRNVSGGASRLDRLAFRSVLYYSTFNTCPDSTSSIFFGSSS